MSILELQLADHNAKRAMQISVLIATAQHYDNVADTHHSEACLMDLTQAERMHDDRYKELMGLSVEARRRASKILDLLANMVEIEMPSAVARSAAESRSQRECGGV